jgi:hypothetical protein
MLAIGYVPVTFMDEGRALKCTRNQNVVFGFTESARFQLAFWHGARELIITDSKIKEAKYA